MTFKIEAQTKQFRYFADKDAVNLNFIEGFFRVSDEVRKYLMGTRGSKRFSPEQRFSLEIECKKEDKEDFVEGAMIGAINGTITKMTEI
jgi:hypothetical protein